MKNNSGIIKAISIWQRFHSSLFRTKDAQSSMSSSDNIKIIWQKIYKNWFGLQKDFSGIQVPECYDPKEHFAVIVAQELTMNEVVIAMGKRFCTLLFSDNLDALVTQNDRTSKGGVI